MYLGIEIGGTKLQVGVGRGDGTIARLWRGAVDVAAGADGIRRQIAAAVPGLLGQAGVDRSRLKAVGIGFGGPTDDATRGVLKSHTVGGWDGFPLAAWAEQEWKLPCAVCNDADVAGLGEALFGAGTGLSPIFYMTIGSGIGGGLIIDRKIYRGTGKGAAEVGHLRLYQLALADQPEGGYLKLEDSASGWAIQRTAQYWLESGPQLKAVFRRSSLTKLPEGNKPRVTAQQVGEAARKGDPLARFILGKVCDDLAEAITHVIALLCPRRIVIGGGVSLMGEDVLFKPLRERVAQIVFRPFADCYDIVPAALGEEVVVHGALALARQQYSREGSQV